MERQLPRQPPRLTRGQITITTLEGKAISSQTLTITP